MSKQICAEFEFVLKNPLFAKELFISNNLKFKSVIDFSPEVQARHDRVRSVFLSENTREKERQGLNDVLTLLRDTLLDLSYHVKNQLSQEIENVFNMTQIASEIESESPKSLENRLDRIIDLMGKICSPARDSEIEELRKNRKANLDFLKSLFSVIDDMRLDMCNSLMWLHHEKLLFHAMKYESVVLLALSKQKKTENPSSCDNIMRIIIEKPEYTEKLKANEIDQKIIDNIIFDFQKYVITYDGVLEIPETMVLDKTRLKVFNSFFTYAIFVATLLNLLKNPLNEILKFDELIELKVIGLAFNIGTGEMHDQTKMRNAADEIILYLKEISQKYNIKPLDDKYKSFFVAKIEQLVCRTDPVWILFKTRIEDAVFTDNKPHQSIEKLSEDLKNLKNSLKRFMEFNRRAHYQTYHDLILEKIAAIDT